MSTYSLIELLTSKIENPFELGSSGQGYDYVLCTLREAEPEILKEARDQLDLGVRVQKILFLQTGFPKDFGHSRAPTQFYLDWIPSGVRWELERKISGYLRSMLSLYLGEAYLITSPDPETPKMLRYIVSCTPLQYQEMVLAFGEEEWIEECNLSELTFVSGGACERMDPSNPYEILTVRDYPRTVRQYSKNWRRQGYEEGDFRPVSVIKNRQIRKILEASGKEETS